MSHFATALAIIGVAFAVAYCSVEVNRSGHEARKFEAEACERAGGRMVRNWGQLVCEYPGAR